MKTASLIGSIQQQQVRKTECGYGVSRIRNGNVQTMMEAFYGRVMRVQEWFRTVAASRKRNPVDALSRHLLRDIGWLDINDEYLH